MANDEWQMGGRLLWLGIVWQAKGLRRGGEMWGQLRRHIFSQRDKRHQIWVCGGRWSFGEFCFGIGCVPLRLFAK